MFDEHVLLMGLYEQLKIMAIVVYLVDLSKNYDMMVVVVQAQVEIHVNDVVVDSDKHVKN
jgi:hypothetical protein